MPDDKDGTEQKAAPRGAANAGEVARHAGVSRSAVSRTFTEGASVSQKTRAKVLAAAQALNYHVNHLARGLSQEKSRPICILGGRLNSPYQAAMLEALTRRLHDAGRVAMVINTAGGEARSQAALEQSLNYRASASVVLSGAPSASLVKSCIDSGQHVVLVNRGVEVEEADHVVLDHDSAIRDAVAMFTRAGCRSLAILSSAGATPSRAIRETLFGRYAVEAGFAPLLLLRAPAGSYDGGVLAARLMLARADRPDGVFCTTDLLACGLMDAARQDFGLSIPNDINIIGFDDIEQAGWGAYGLTTFRQPIEDMATDIVTRITAREEEEGRQADAKRTATFHALPIWRKTVRPG